MTPTSADRDPGTPGPARGPAPAGLIWTRPPKEKRERPTREAIVAAATGLAGTRGLDAVSIRRVAAALQTRPMDLYRYFAMDESDGGGMPGRTVTSYVLSAAGFGAG